MRNYFSVSMTRKEIIAGWIFLAFHLLLIPVALLLLGFLPFFNISPALTNFLYFVISFTATACIFSRFIQKNWQIFLRRPGYTLQSAALGFLIYQLCALAIAAVNATLMPDYRNINDAAISLLVEENYAMMAIGSVFLVPITEEILYRGLVFRGLHRKSKLMAYSLSAVFFALIHITGYIGTYDWKLLLLCFLQYIPAGLCLAWAYARADSIFAPILMHMTINAMGITAMR